MIHQFRLKNSALVEFIPEHCKIIINKIPGAPEELTLARAESRILELLLMEPGAICSREAILEFAWDDRVVSAGSLNQSIFMLRNILGDGKDHEIVITVPRRGYRFNSDFLVALPEVADDPVEEPPPARAPSTTIPANLPDTRHGIGAAVWLGYLTAAIVTLFTLWHIYSWYKPTTEMHMTTIEQGELTISAVGKSELEVNKLKADFLNAGLPDQNLKGQVFISRTGPRINLSCIRETGEAYNLEYQFQDERFISMLRKCVTGEK